MAKVRNENIFGVRNKMVGVFHRGHKKEKSRVEEKFQTIVDLIKDLDKREFNRLKEGINLAWQAYNKVSQAKTATEKELEDIEETEKVLEEGNGRD